MTPVAQTRYGRPNGNCFAACVASILDRPLDDVDVDVSSCDEMRQLIEKIQEKAKCKIYGFPYGAIVDEAVKSTERYCIVDVCSFMFNHDPFHPSSERHGVVCEIAENGKLTLVFNPCIADQRKKLEDFPGPGNLFIVKSGNGL